MCYWCKLGQKDDSADALSEASGEGTINNLTPELNSSAQRCLTTFFTWDFAY
jgi:hypothetical protein